MIHGIGTDLAEVARFARALAAHGERFAARLLAAGELPEFHAAPDPARFLAKRFAAKEAFGKALGTGVRVPATLHAIGIGHDALGKPAFRCSPALDDYLRQRGLRPHLSITDEAGFALAFVVIEHVEP